MHCPSLIVSDHHEIGIPRFTDVARRSDSPVRNAIKTVRYARCPETRCRYPRALPSSSVDIHALSFRLLPGHL